MWRTTAGSSTDLRADANGDLAINEADYQIWRSRFGTVYASSAIGSAAAVPEPQWWSLLLIVAGTAVATGRRHRSH